MEDLNNLVPNLTQTIDSAQKIFESVGKDIDIRNIFDTSIKPPSSPLHTACIKGDTETVKRLLATGIQDIPDDTGKTALHLAAQKGQCDVVKLLLKSGISASSRDSSGSTPLHLACQSLASQQFSSDAPTFDRAYTNSVGDIMNEISKTLASLGNILKSIDEMLPTRLYNTITLLLSSESPVNAQNHDGKAPIHLAAFGHVKLIHMLIDFGADVNLQDTTEQQTALHCAAAHGNLDVVRQLVLSRCKVNVRDAQGKTAFMETCYGGDIELIKFLLESGSDIDNLDDKGASVLHYACGTGRLDIAKLLLAHGARVRVFSEPLGWTPLHVCCHLVPCNMQILDQLLIYGADVNAVGHNGETPLLVACMLENKDAVVRLIKAGAMVNVVDQKGYSALHTCASNGFGKIIKILLEFGANPNIEDQDGSTPLLCASCNDDEKIIETLLHAGACVNAINQNKHSALHFAALFNNNKVASLLIESGAAVNATNESGQSSLHLPCRKGHFQIVKLLLESGADINAFDVAGQSPLISAVQVGNLDMIKLLVECGADVNLFGEAGITALGSACYNGNLSVTKYLLSHGSSINSPIQGFQPPLNRAVISGNVELVKIILDAGADVNQAWIRGRTTALCAAASLGLCDMVELLLNYGADINESTFGFSPMHCACQYGKIDVAKLLLKYEAKLDAATVDLHTPLHFACLHGHLDVVRFLIDNGAKINVQDCDGQTPICASVLGNASLLRGDVSTTRKSLMTQLGVWQRPHTQKLCEKALDPVLFYEATETGLQIKPTSLESKLECAKILLQEGALTSISNRTYNLTVLHGLCLTLIHWTPESECTISLLFDLWQSILDNSEYCLKISESDHYTTPLDILLLNPDINNKVINTMIWMLLKNMNWNFSIQKMLYAILPKYTGQKRNQSLIENIQRYLPEIWSLHTPFSALLCRLSINQLNYMWEKLSHKAQMCILSHQNFLGQSVLHILAQTPKNQVLNINEKLKWLSDRGVSFDAVDINGRTPFHLACITRNTDFLRQCFVSQISNTFEKADNVGKIPAHYFATHDDAESEYFLRDILLEERDLRQIQTVFPEDVTSSQLQNAVPGIKPLSLTMVTELMESPHFGVVQFKGENKDVFVAVHALMDVLCVVVGQLDSRFTCRAKLSGSVAERTKTGYPDEFDFMITFLKLLESFHLSIQPFGQTYYARFEEKKSNMDEFWRLLPDGTKDFSAAYFCSRFWQLVFKALTHDDVRDVLKQYPLTVDDCKRKAGFVGNLRVTWHGLQHHNLAVSIDMLPALLYQDYICLLTPRHFDQEEVGNKFIRGFDFSNVLRDRKFFLSLNQSISDGYRLAKLLRNITTSFQVSGRILEAGEVLQSYLLKSTLFWVLDPKYQFEKVYTNLNRDDIFKLEDQSALLFDVYNKSLENVRACERGTFNSSIGGFINLQEVLSKMSDTLQVNKGRHTADTIVGPYLLEAYIKSGPSTAVDDDSCKSNSTANANPGSMFSHNKTLDVRDTVIYSRSTFVRDIHKSNMQQRAREARRWALRIFRMLKYLLTNGKQVHNYFLTHNHVLVRDVELSIVLCQVFEAFLCEPGT